MYVYTPVRNNAGRATTLALAHYPFSGQPPSRRAPALPRALPPSLPCHTNPYRYLYALPPTTHIARLFLPRPTPSSPSPLPLSPHIALHLNSVSTASLLLPSATHTTTHSFHPRHVRRPSLPFTYLSLSLSVSTSVFLKRPIQSTRRVRPYGAVSTGTPARSLKENAIIRRTSTNELIVGASRYRQYREVLYSTSPGATRL